MKKANFVMIIIPSQQVGILGAGGSGGQIAGFTIQIAWQLLIIYSMGSFGE